MSGMNPWCSFRRVTLRTHASVNSLPGRVLMATCINQ